MAFYFLVGISQQSPDSNLNKYIRKQIFILNSLTLHCINSIQLLYCCYDLKELSRNLSRVESSFLWLNIFLHKSGGKCKHASEIHLAFRSQWKTLSIFLRIVFFRSNVIDISSQREKNLDKKIGFWKYLGNRWNTLYKRDRVTMLYKLHFFVIYFIMISYKGYTTTNLSEYIF